MRRRLVTLALAAALATGGAIAVPAQAAPPGPQCGSVRDCSSPVQQIIQKVTETCKYAYCQLP